MSMPPRSRTGSGQVVALVIIALVVLVGAAVLWAGGITPQRLWDSFFPIGGLVTMPTEQGRATKELYDFVFYLAAAIFFAVEALIVFTVFRFRRRPGDDTLPPQTHGNQLVEMIWTAIPTAIVLLLFVMSWQTLNKVDARQPSDVHIRAVAARFQWQFEYLDANGGTLYTQNVPLGDSGGMVVPVGEPVLVSLRSPDVIHAFYVPKFLFKRDVVPGRENTFNFTVDEPGTYRGQCAELCGTFHASMVFDVHALPRAEFDTWLKAQASKPKPSAAPAASASVPPSQAAPEGSASAAPVPSGPGGEGATAQLTAQGIAYTSSALETKADQPWQLQFTNADAGTPHNVAIKDASGADKFTGEIITGPAKATYDIPALPAGAYTFVCSVHPNMTGTLTVK